MTNEIIIRHMEYDDFYIDRTGESLYSTGSITIDWGDGTTETTNNNTYSYSHNYRDFVEDDEGIQTYAGYITVTISGVEEIRDDFLSIESFGGQYIDAVTIPNNITSIGNNFCYNQEHLHYLTLSNSLTTIGDDFCYGCYLSNGLELPDSLTSIGNNFCNVTGYLDTLTLPDNITTIGDNFCVYSALTSFTIPNSIVSIGDYFLDGCSLLTGNIIIPNSVENIGNDFLTGCGITSIIFETNSAIDGIPDYFACSCMNLTNISFPDNLETIGTNFCCNCPSLTRVEFPEGLIEIGENFLNGEAEFVHLNKLIFPSSFRYLNYGLLGSSIDKVIFKSVIPVDMSAGYPDQFESMIIHVPKNCTDAYANAFTEAFGDYGEDSLSDPNHYRENLTLPEATAKFGTLMRANLKRKGIETQRNDGLTTLINKVNDIETNDMTGFLADIGFYDTDNWYGAVTVLKDKLIINDDSEFSFDNIDFPDTFTWYFVILPQNSEDAFGIGPNTTIQPNDYNVSNIDGYIKYEEMMVISRENGGDFAVFFVIKGDEFSISDLTENYLSFSPATENPIVIQNIYFSEETYEYDYYYDYEKIIYSVVFDKDSSIRPSTIPILLLKDNKPVDEYPINNNTKYLFGGEHWICYHHKAIDDTSQYSWIAPSDIGYRIMDTYSVVKHNYNNRDYRIDHYIECDELYGYDEPDTENIGPWLPTMDSDYGGSFDYITGEDDEHHLTKEWGLTFEYIRLNETNNNIGFSEYIYNGSQWSLIFFSLSDNKFHIKIGENVYSSNTVALQEYNFQDFPLVISVYQEINDNQMLRWRVDINHETFFVYDSSININDFDYCTLPMQCYQSNAQIRNFHYWNKKNQKFLFYDGCTSDKTSQYSTLWRTSDNLGTDATLTYDSTEQAYTFIGSGGDAFVGRAIPNVRGEDDIKIRCKVKFKNSNVYNQLSIIISDSLYQPLNGDWDMFRVWGNGHTDHLQKNESKWESSVSALYVNQNYCYLEIIKQGTTITYNLYDVSLDILKTATLTGLTYTSPYFIIGLNGKYNSENYGKFIKEILVQKI